MDIKKIGSYLAPYGLTLKFGRTGATRKWFAILKDHHGNEFVTENKSLEKAIQTVLDEHKNPRADD